MDAARDAEREQARLAEQAVETRRVTVELDARGDEPVLSDYALLQHQNRIAILLDKEIFNAWLAQIEGVTIKHLDQDHERARDYDWTIDGLDAWNNISTRDHWHVRESVRKKWRSGDGEGAASELMDAGTRHSRRVQGWIAVEREQWKKRIDSIIEERAASINMRWTADLLTTTVALPDGSRVAWGAATREQHAVRLEMLKKHATTELETATRHQAAIDALDAAGVDCLNELPSDR